MARTPPLSDPPPATGPGSADSTRRLLEAAALKRLVGVSPALTLIKQQILMAAKSDVTVLVTGETGTGKELVAQAIHYLSPRAARPFIPVNCGAIPATLFENELFGHRPGAFTDARSREVGLLTEAENGTLFLDELDALPLTVQVKLLRFLEDHTYRPLGSSRTIRADVRMVTATNADLRQALATGAFRMDLYYRLSVIHLVLPPLRDRGGDVVLLAEHFLQRHAPNGGWRFSPPALDVLRSYHWPGNVRELQNLIQRLVIMGSPRVIGSADLPLPQSGAQRPETPGSFRAARDAAIRQFERAYLERLLDQHGGNITHAAREARQDRSSFRRLLRKHGLRA
jgi:DNA-binding NtrC family response regulator